MICTIHSWHLLFRRRRHITDSLLILLMTIIYVDLSNILVFLKVRESAQQLSLANYIVYKSRRRPLELKAVVKARTIVYQRTYFIYTGFDLLQLEWFLHPLLIYISSAFSHNEDHFALFVPFCHHFGWAIRLKLCRGSSSLRCRHHCQLWENRNLSLVPRSWKHRERVSPV